MEGKGRKNAECARYPRKNKDASQQLLVSYTRKDSFPFTSFKDLHASAESLIGDKKTYLNKDNTRNGAFCKRTYSIKFRKVCVFSGIFLAITFPS